MSGIFEGFADAEHSEEILSLAIGKVKENYDQKHPGMVKVDYFLGTTGKNLTAWVPVAVPYAADGYGEYFLPEVGSAVVMGFNMGDRNMPIVIGCLWNDVNKLPKDVAAKDNPTKLIRTKAGNAIRFEEKSKKEAIRIDTPAELEFDLSDEKKTITLKDKNAKNQIQIKTGEGQIQITAEKKITLKCGSATVTIDGQAGKVSIDTNQVEINGKSSLKLKGANTSVQGTMTEVKGDSKLTVQSGAMTEVKGAMVKIN
ncbi:MAG: hypothetical protein IJ679_12655 [Lachnospiraceae bacterium]|nr:hypothetical protein [Lachnospiraceae bacterium]